MFHFQQPHRAGAVPNPAKIFIGGNSWANDASAEHSSHALIVARKIGESPIGKIASFAIGNAIKNMPINTLKSSGLVMSSLPMKRLRFQQPIVAQAMAILENTVP